MQKYGFIYIWRDRKHKRYYIGSHWGNESDRYICSSTWMRNSYKRRPQDFKRRILAKIYTNRKDLLKEEYKWLLKIKKIDLGKKYYNLKIFLQSEFFPDKNQRILINEKISKSNIGKKASEETRKKQSEKKKGKPSPNRGKIFSKKHRENLSKSHIGKSLNTIRKDSKSGIKYILWYKKQQKWGVKIKGKQIGISSNFDKAKKILENYLIQ